MHSEKINKIFHIFKCFIPLDSKFHAEETLQKHCGPINSKQDFFKKNIMYIKKFRKQPFLRYSKNIRFFCSTCTIIIMKWRVIKKYQVVSFKNSARKISSKSLIESRSLTFQKYVFIASMKAL